jgi:predicted metal-dependent HD superfamily phosphohydrolase
MNSQIASQAWRRLMGDLAIEANQEREFEKIEAAYGEPARAYHTMAHIIACLDTFVAARHLATAPERIELAIWFHDIVYDTRRGDNEDRSA